ncbi:MAG: methyltransferase [Myxococcales bacterium]
MGSWVAQALGAVARLGVADQLASGPKSSGDLAKAVGAHAESLRRTMRALASVGIFSVPNPDHWSLTPLGDCLRTDAVGSLRYMLIAETDHAHWATWGRFTDAVRSGQPQAQTALGMMPWDYYAAHPEDGSAFSRAMANISSMATGPLLASYDFSNAPRIADIGGAYGALLAAVLRSQPKARGILFDRPHVVAGADEVLGDVSARVERVGGDFLSQSVPAADIYLLKHILHDWDDDTSVKILQNLRAGMPPGARALIIELILPEQIEPGPGAWMDLNMLVMLGGKERSAAGYETLLARAGLKTKRVIATPSPFGIVEAVAK